MKKQAIRKTDNANQVQMLSAPGGRTMSDVRTGVIQTGGVLCSWTIPILLPVNCGTGRQT